MTRSVDSMTRWVASEALLRAFLMERLGAAAGERILELGCGTGSLAIAIAGGHPPCCVVAVDADRGAVDIAMAREPDGVRWWPSFAHDLPFADGAFDAVVCALLFHKLSNEEKRESLNETFRVLRPGGRLLLAHWRRSRTPSRGGSAPGAEGARAADSAVPELIARAGFQDVSAEGHLAARLGTQAVYRARRPDVTSRAGTP